MNVEVEASKHHDGVVEIVLVRNKKLGRPIKDHLLLVVGRIESLKDTGRDSKKGQVLDIRVVDRVIGHDVMDIV